MRSGHVPVGSFYEDRAPGRVWIRDRQTGITFNMPLTSPSHVALSADELVVTGNKLQERLSEVDLFPVEVYDRMRQRLTRLYDLLEERSRRQDGPDVMIEWNGKQYPIRVYFVNGR